MTWSPQRMASGEVAWMGRPNGATADWFKVRQLKSGAWTAYRRKAIRHVMHSWVRYPESFDTREAAQRFCEVQP